MCFELNLMLMLILIYRGLELGFRIAWHGILEVLTFLFGGIERDDHVAVVLIQGWVLLGFMA